MSEQLQLLPVYLPAHLRLTLVTLLIGVVVSVPLGILVTRVAWLERWVLGVASVVQTIPGLALLAVMVPLLAALRFPSIGMLPAVLGLSLYSILPLLRNIVTGIRGVDPMYVEAARGVGMTPRQQLWRVELPLALPVMIAGLRTATVWTVGMATLSTPIGAPSLGNYLFAGLQTRNFAAVLVGAAAAAVLALVLDGLVGVVELGVRRRRPRWVAAAFVVVALLYGYTATTLAHSLGKPSADVTLGAKTFTEQYILGEILEQTLESGTALDVQVLPSLGSTVAFDALVNGEIDAYVDYSGTLWATILKRSDVPDRAAVLAEVRRYLWEKHHVRVAVALGFENAYALALREGVAARLGIAGIADLAPHAPGWTIGGDYEFFARPEWRAVQETYGLAFREERSMDPSLMYAAAAAGDVDVLSAFSTDGRIDAFGLRVLQDARGAIPPYDAVVLLGARILEEHPEVEASLATLEGAIDAGTMRAMNRAVDEDSRSPADVAREFLANRRGS